MRALALKRIASCPLKRVIAAVIPRIRPSKTTQADLERQQLPHHCQTTLSMFWGTVYKIGKVSFLFYSEAHSSRPAWNCEACSSNHCDQYLRTYRISEFCSFQDPPCTLNWEYMVPDSRYLGLKKGGRRV